MTGQSAWGIHTTQEQWPGDPAAQGGEKTKVSTDGHLTLGENLDSPQTSEQPPLRKTNKSL